MGDSYFKNGPTEGTMFVELSLGGKTYPLEQFSTELIQSVSGKTMEPMNEVTGGLLYITMVQVPDAKLIKWASDRTARENGEIAFKNNSGTSPLKISFEEAACINMSQTCGEGIGSFITLTISPKKVKFNSVELDKNW